MSLVSVVREHVFGLMLSAGLPSGGENFPKGSLSDVGAGLDAGPRQHDIRSLHPSASAHATLENSLSVSKKVSLSAWVCTWMVSRVAIESMRAGFLSAALSPGSSLSSWSGCCLISAVVPGEQSVGRQ